MDIPFEKEKIEKNIRKTLRIYDNFKWFFFCLFSTALCTVLQMWFIFILFERNDDRHSSNSSLFKLYTFQPAFQQFNPNLMNELQKKNKICFEVAANSEIENKSLRIASYINLFGCPFDPEMHFMLMTAFKVT